jgi:hypothetical protein
LLRALIGRRVRDCIGIENHDVSPITLGKSDATFPIYEPISTGSSPCCTNVCRRSNTGNLPLALEQDKKRHNRWDG